MGLRSSENVTGADTRADTGTGRREESRWREKMTRTDGVIGKGEAGEPQTGK